MKALALSSVLVASLCVTGPARAIDTLTVNIDRTDGGGNLAVGQLFTYEIHGQLTNTGPNFGLAFFAYDLEVTGPSAITLSDAIVQSGGPDVGKFDREFGGYSVDFDGTVDGDTLSQAGGGQNTIDNVPDEPPNVPFPSGEPVANIGHGAGVVLHLGRFTIPAGTADGEYTLRIIPGSLYANVLDAPPAVGADPVIAAETTIGNPLIFTVQSDAAAPELIHQADEGPRSSPCSGYIDPRFDSSNGTDVDLCFTSWNGSEYVPDEIVMVFSEQVRNAGGGALTAEAFSVQVTGGIAPGVSSVNAVMDGDLHIVTIKLDGPIPVKEWTTVIAGVEDFGGNLIASSGNQGPGVAEPDRIDIACLPGDVNQNGSTSAIDLVRAKQRQLGTCNSCPECSGALLGYDIDRKGSVSPVDLARLKQLFLEAGNASRVWNGQFIVPAQP